MIGKLLFSRIKSIVPKVSPTELIALRSGTVSIDRDIFNGYVNIPIKKKEDDFQNKFSQEVLYELLEKYKNDQTIYPSNKSKEIMDFVCSNKFLSCIIDEKYGGKKFKCYRTIITSYKNIIQ